MMSVTRTYEKSELRGKAESCGLFPGVIVTNQESPLKQRPLPYSRNALEPMLSEEQIKYHYDKHHASYFKKLEELIKDQPENKLSIEEIILQSKPGKIFNNAAQAWNHSFFWNCMAPSGKCGNPCEKTSARIEKDFGSMPEFKKAFIEAAMGIFGSGWCWLVCDQNGKMEIMPLSNADCPQKHGRKPILVVDTWEHAYYVDYRNEKEKFFKKFFDCINWEFVSAVYSIE